MSELNKQLAELYIKILNRFPDDLAYRMHIPLLKKENGYNYVKRKLERSPEFKYRERDIIFENYVNKNKDKFEKYTKELPLKSNRCALICEGRKHKHIDFIVKQTLYHLDNNWTLMIVCTNENIEYMKKKLKDIKNVIYKITPKLDNFIDYNDLLLSKEFWNELLFEKVLIFQTDTLMLRKGIETFIEYDYVGAPSSKSFKIMNGGFSLRTVSKMIECLEHTSPNEYEEEDKFFTRILKCLSCNLPNFDIAKEFSIEHIYHNLPFAMHKAWRYLDIEHILDAVEFQII